MDIELQLTDKLTDKENIVFLIKNKDSLDNCHISNQEKNFILDKLKKEKKQYFSFNRLTHYQIIFFIQDKSSVYQTLEFVRKEGDKTAGFLNRHKQKSVILNGINIDIGLLTAFAEGMILGNYKFSQYKSKEKPDYIQKISFTGGIFTNQDIDELKSVTEAVYHCRDLVNTPLQELQSKDFANRITQLINPLGVKTRVFSKTQIASLRMAGIIAVNRGSTNDPAFIQLEWKPENYKNHKPVVFVGKGIVFDTGGLSLKPPSAMEDMKADMAGGAAVFAAIYAIAKSKLPIHVIGLIPATDNQPGSDALAPGDIIKMSNNVTVEVLNTDAEGRLILADALCYASKFDPSLVIDVATLTGSATRAIGKYGIVAVESDAENQLNDLKKSGMEVYERIAQLPFWEEYDKEIESDIADIRNIGKSNNAGAITAGKFLKHFVNYPWIHLDIAGMAYMEQKESYLGKGASGVGVRLLYRFIKNMQMDSK